MDNSNQWLFSKFEGLPPSVASEKERFHPLPLCSAAGGWNIWRMILAVPSNCLVPDSNIETSSSSAHRGCSWLFINTMQTVQCGCTCDGGKKKGPEQVNTSFIMSFVWCVYCVLFLVNSSCLTVLQKGEKPFLELYPFVLSQKTKFFCLLFSLYCKLSV